MDEASVLSSFSASSSTVLNKVNERKRAEAEVALLANRLQHLRNEHARTRQRMETTRSRTREILKMKDAKNREADEKARAKARQERLDRIPPPEVFDAGFWKPAAVEAQWGPHNPDDDDGDAKATAKKAKDKVRKDILDENAGRAAEIRKRREVVRKQKLEAELKKDRETQARVKKRLSAEDARIEKSNTLVRRMEVEEQKLIEQLEHSQQLQHNAFAELQSTLGF